MIAQPIPNPEVRTQTQAQPMPVEPYVKLPHGLLARRDIGDGEKLLLAYLWGFGVQGCWRGNQTLALLFGTSPRQITRRVAALKDSGDLFWHNGRNQSRILWAARHPDVIAADYLPYKNTDRTILRKAVERTRKRYLRQPARLDKNVQAGSPEMSKPLGQKCPQIIKEKEQGNERQGTADKPIGKQAPKRARNNQVQQVSGGCRGETGTVRQGQRQGTGHSPEGTEPANLTDSDRGAAPGSLRTIGDVRDQQSGPRPPGSFFHPRNPHIEKEVRDSLAAIEGRLTQNPTPMIDNSLDSPSGSSPRRSRRSGPSSPPPDLPTQP